MTLDFPISPNDGDIYAGSNGINYQWNDTKGLWEVYVDPSTQTTPWARDSITGVITQSNPGDNIELRNSTNTDTTITLTSDGTITATNFDIASLDALP